MQLIRNDIIFIEVIRNQQKICVHDTVTLVFELPYSLRVYRLLPTNRNRSADLNNMGVVC